MDVSSGQRLSSHVLWLNIASVVAAPNHVISIVVHLRLKPNTEIMRKFLFLVLLVLLTLPVFGQKKLTEIDLRVNGIGSGTSYSTVVRKLGSPTRRKTEKIKASLACSNTAETHFTLFYSGLKITLLGDGKGHNLSVYSIEVTSPRWKASGISVGANINEVETKFGKPISKADISGETVLYYVTKENLGGVNFYLKDNKLVRVRMNETLC